MGEFELIARYFDRSGQGRAPAPGVLLGVGDDCALLAVPTALAVSTDMLVAGRHFYDDVSPDALGHKALAVNLSDLAAMGARPFACTLALALPQADGPWLEGFARGFFALADRYGCELVGGDTTRGPLNICVTVLGQLAPESALRRDAARPGDDVWVSGRLGGAAWAVRARQQGLAADPGACARLDRPQPRVALGLALVGVAHAAIDLSDGLIGDLGHVLRRSSQAAGLAIGAVIQASRVPVDETLSGLAPRTQLELALAGGDDYELLFCAPVSARDRIDAIGLRLGLPLARIGCLDESPGLRVCDDAGRTLELPASGFDHFGT